MMMSNEKVYYVKYLRMLNWLIAKGFRNYEVIPDPTSHKNYNWFVFERTPEFDAAVEEYHTQFKN